MTTKERKYRVAPPIGTVVVPKREMTERELREFALQISTETEAEAQRTWAEKVEKDPITDVIEWLTQKGYAINQA